MTDHELLELAAKAAGINVLVAPSNAAKLGGLYCWINKTRKPWNPLTDDGDALRLAVKLHFGINVVCGLKITTITFYAAPEGPYIKEDHGIDPEAATRRAIVLAAAEIGAQE